MTQREIKLLIIEKAELIAELLTKKNDVELRTDANGIKIIAVKKTVV